MSPQPRSPAGLAAIAKYLMRDKQNLDCLRVREGLMTLEKMYFADEIRPLDPLRPEKESSVDQKELDMACSSRQPPHRLRAHPIPRHLSRHAVRDHQAEAPRARPSRHLSRTAPAQVPDLIAALQASLDRSKGAAKESSANGSSLKSLSKDDLYKRAQERDIPGRADMTKDQLVAALRPLDL